MSRAVRHHTIPRFLLERFGERRKNSFYIFRTDAEGQTVQMNINHATVQREFYGKDDYDGGNLEGNFNDIMKTELRTFSLAQSKTIARFVSVQKFRTQAFRAQAISALCELSESRVRTDYIPLIRENLKSYSLKSTPVNVLANSRRTHVIDALNETIDDVFTQNLINITMIALKQISSKLDTTQWRRMIDGVTHDSILVQNLSQRPISILDVDFNLFLSDDPVLLIKNEKLCHLEDTSMTDATSIILPITSRKILVIGKNEILKQKINDYSAENSYQFIYCQDQKIDKHTIKKIGRRKSLLSPVSIQDIVEQSFLNI